jgi:hypothetical protein
MAKRKKTEKPTKTVEPLTNFRKDIDDIFAIKKVVNSPIEPPKNDLPKPAKVQSSSAADVSAIVDEFATVQSQVRSVKAERSKRISHIAKEDNFADIRGMKKRIVFT